MANATQTIVLFKWTFIWKATICLIQGELLLMGTLHIVRQPFPWNKLSDKENESPWLKWFWKLLSADHSFTFESLVGLGTVNITCGMLPIYHALGIGTGLLTYEQLKRQMVGELAHHSAMQWPQDEGVLDRFDSGQWGYRKVYEAQSGLDWNVRGCLPYTALLCSHFFLITQNNDVFQFS